MRASLVVFAREPVPGQVKSRLAAAVGDRAAARIYATLLERTLEVADSSACDVTVSLAGPPSGAWVEGWDGRTEVQAGGDLGERMRDAFDRRFDEGYDRVVIVGSDCPILRNDHLVRAVEALHEYNLALGPSRDGGYWLVAQRRPGVDLFTGVPWSTSETLGATRTRLGDLGVRWVELDELDDVDTEEDLRNALDDPDIDPDLRERLLNAWKASNS